MDISVGFIIIFSSDVGSYVLYWCCMFLLCLVGPYSVMVYGPVIDTAMRNFCGH